MLRISLGYVWIQKMRGKEKKGKEKKRKSERKIKNRFKFNKLFLYVFSNLIYLFPTII